MFSIRQPNRYSYLCLKPRLSSLPLGLFNAFSSLCSHFQRTPLPAPFTVIHLSDSRPQYHSNITDTLSVAAGTLAFVTAALSVAQSTCKLIDNIKNAGLEVDSLASQMKEFVEVLRKLQQLADFIKASPDETIRRAGVSPGFVKDCISELQNVQLIVMAINAELSSGQTRRFFSKMRWSLKRKNQVAICTSRITGRTDCLLLALGVLQR